MVAKVSAESSAISVWSRTWDVLLGHLGDLMAHQASADSAPTTIDAVPCTIDQPGTYVLARDLTWASTGPAILIASSDVTLDLGGHRIAAAAYTEVFDVSYVPLWSIGVQVGDLFSGKLTNVKVHNGALEGFNGSLFSTALVASNTTSLKLESLEIQHVGATISFGASVGALLINSSACMAGVKIRHITGSVLMTSGVLLVGTKEVTIKDCAIEDISNAAGIAASVGAIACSETNITKTSVSRMMTGLTHNPHAFGHTCIGMMLTSCRGVTITDCSITDISGGMDDAHGISLFGVSTAKVRGVSVARVSDGRGGRGSKATGIEVYGERDVDDNRIEISKCSVSDISAFNPGDLQAAGFSAAGAGISFTDCRATKVHVTGFDPSTPDHMPGLGVGFGWAPDFRAEWSYPAKKVKLERCVASRCDVGFATFNFQDSSWQDCNAKDAALPVLRQERGDTRTFFADQGSEGTHAMRGGFIHVTVTNQARDNIFDPPFDCEDPDQGS